MCYQFTLILCVVSVFSASCERTESQNHMQIGSFLFFRHIRMSRQSHSGTRTHSVGRPIDGHRYQEMHSARSDICRTSMWNMNYSADAHFNVWTDRWRCHYGWEPSFKFCVLSRNHFILIFAFQHFRSSRQPTRCICLFYFDSFLWLRTSVVCCLFFSYILVNGLTVDRVMRLEQIFQSDIRSAFFFALPLLFNFILCSASSKFQERKTPRVFRRANNMSQVTMLTRESVSFSQITIRLNKSSNEPKHGRPSTQSFIHRLLSIRATASDSVFHFSFASFESIIIFWMWSTTGKRIHRPSVEFSRRNDMIWFRFMFLGVSGRSSDAQSFAHSSTVRRTCN